MFKGAIVLQMSDALICGGTGRERNEGTLGIAWVFGWEAVMFDSMGDVEVVVCHQSYDQTTYLVATTCYLILQCCLRSWALE